MRKLNPMIRVPTPLEPLYHPLLDEHQVTLWIKRDDLIHPEIMGNKWRKLKYNLQYARENGFGTIVTMGGAYSNHIAATAAAGREFGFETIGIIRGDELQPHSNATLRAASEHGMVLRFVDRQTYREWRDQPGILRNRYPDAYLLPEGGTNALALQGVAELVDEIQIPFDTIVTPVGTGGTLAGIVQGLKGSSHALGISVLKGDFIRHDVQRILDGSHIKRDNFSIQTGYHRGGYGQADEEFLTFIREIRNTSGLTLDPIYTGKAFFGVLDMVKQGVMNKQVIVFLHTGGLQGIAGFMEKNRTNLPN
jgi:1-aminocyclopropane-1-carboxylate deaminase